MELHQKGDCGSVANPTLVEICEIMSESLRGLSRSAQSRAFEHCLLTLPTDGSQDDERGAPNTMKLLRKHNVCLVPNAENSVELFPETATSSITEGTMTSIWESLINAEPEPFQLDFAWPYPARYASKSLLSLSAAAAARKKKKR